MASPCCHLLAIFLIFIVCTLKSDFSFRLKLCRFRVVRFENGNLRFEWVARIRRKESGGRHSHDLSW